MADKTGIEWTDATWNPVRGCSRVSEGCRNCYAESVAYRFSGPGQPYEGLVQIGADGERRSQWNGTVRFVEEHLLDPLKWKKPRRIFVNSMSDLFHEGVTDEQLDRIFAVMALCPQHTFQVLTKRPERMMAYLKAPGKQSDIRMVAGDLAFDVQSLKKYPESMMPSNAEIVYDLGAAGDECGCRVTMKWPLPNVWLGVSVEDQQTADERIPVLMQAPVWVRFVSAEPLLGPIDLTNFLYSRPGIDTGRLNRLHWVIVGGESGAGPGIRPMHPDWARRLRDECVAAGVPFFFKQNGAFVSVSAVAGPGKHFTFPDGATVRRVGKKAAGDLLDGQQWHQFPEVRR